MYRKRFSALHEKALARAVLTTELGVPSDPSDVQETSHRATDGEADPEWAEVQNDDDRDEDTIGHVTSAQDENMEDGDDSDTGGPDTGVLHKTSPDQHRFSNVDQVQYNTDRHIVSQHPNKGTCMLTGYETCPIQRRL